MAGVVTDALDKTYEISVNDIFCCKQLNRRMTIRFVK